jgi:anhydro-N-acetylmuramic acid kinase
MQRSGRCVKSDIGRHAAFEQSIVQARVIRAVRNKAAVHHNIQKVGFRRKGHLLPHSVCSVIPIGAKPPKEKIMFTKKPTICVGAMSGTSLDGVDGAQITTDGEDIFEFGPTRYVGYSTQEKQALQEVLGKWADEKGLECAHDLIHRKHFQVLSQFPKAALFGFHGQTLAHDPKSKRTHQLGDGQVLADALGRPVAWDFRSADIGLGGEGAPMAPFFHFACAKWITAKAPLVILNLGGVGNLTWIDPSKTRPEDQGALLAFDTGPANAPINDMMHQRLGLDMDREGALAAKGFVLHGALEVFLRDPYFWRVPPKSLDRNAFVTLFDLVKDLSDADAVATLTAICAECVLSALDFCPSPPERILVTGGGRHNKVMMQMIAAGATCPVIPVEEVGLDGDMLEAQAFAYLAMRVARGLATSGPTTTGVAMLTGGGILSPA